MLEYKLRTLPEWAIPPNAVRKAATSKVGTKGKLDADCDACRIITVMVMGYGIWAMVILGRFYVMG